MDKYNTCIWWSEEYKCYFAEIPELEGCRADGETKEGALRELEIVKDLWIEVQTERGYEVPKPDREEAAIKNVRDII